jgi:hypothetical protein
MFSNLFSENYVIYRYLKSRVETDRPLMTIKPANTHSYVILIVFLGNNDLANALNVTFIRILLLFF